jgi:hypothetical protein
MIRHILLLLGVSILIIFTNAYVLKGLKALLHAHNWISDGLMKIFSSEAAGNWFRELLSFLAIPLLVGLVAALIYYGIKRKKFSYTPHIIWLVWVIQAVTVVLLG